MIPFFIKAESVLDVKLKKFLIISKFKDDYLEEVIKVKDAQKPINLHWIYSHLNRDVDYPSYQFYNYCSLLKSYNKLNSKITVLVTDDDNKKNIVKFSSLVPFPFIIKTIEFLNINETSDDDYKLFEGITNLDNSDTYIEILNYMIFNEEFLDCMKNEKKRKILSIILYSLCLRFDQKLKHQIKININNCNVYSRMMLTCSKFVYFMEHKNEIIPKSVDNEKINRVHFKIYEEIRKIKTSAFNSFSNCEGFDKEVEPWFYKTAMIFIYVYHVSNTEGTEYNIIKKDGKSKEEERKSV